MISANDPGLTSWVEVAADSDFPIQNLPFGIFKTRYLSPVGGVAIGNYVLDLVYLHEHGFLDGLELPPGIFNQRYLNDFLALGKTKARAVRERISKILRHNNDELKGNAPARELALIPMAEVQLQMPLRVPDYTDFYSSEEHARNVGSMFRDPANALLPNWKHVPVAYHGRASSLIVSGTPLHRPKGQIKTPTATEPVFSASQKLDFELEVAFVTCKDTTLGSSINTRDAADHIFGFVLLNDWSARDIQQWEYVPLGPFLGKNFATTISPWIVTMDALEPFRVEGRGQVPPVLPYLSTSGNRNFDVMLEVAIRTDAGDTIVCRSNFKYLYWNVDQQLAHHTVNGCPIRVGDVMASGTISGPSPGSFGSMLELTWNGEKPLSLRDGTERKFLADGDTVVLRGRAEKDGVRIGFGECSGKILSAVE